MPSTLVRKEALGTPAWEATELGRTEKITVRPAWPALSIARHSPKLWPSTFFFNWKVFEVPIAACSSCLSVSRAPASLWPGDELVDAEELADACRPFFVLNEIWRL